MKKQLINELMKIRKRIAGLKKSQTKSNQAEEAFGESKETARALLNAASDSVFLIDATGKLLALNEITAKRLNKPIDELLGSHIHDSLPPEVARRRKRHFDEAFRTGKTVYFEDERNGRCFETFAYPILDANGKVTKLAISARDITERKRTEQELRTTSLYARSLIEASPDPLVTISPDGKITDVNKATEFVIGLSRERLKGSDFSEYFTEPGKAREGYQKVISQGFVMDYPLTIRHTSGRTTDVLYNAAVYRNEAGEVQGVLAAARDITDRKRAVEALRQSEEKYRLITSCAKDGIFTLDMTGKITFVSPRWLSVTGYVEREIIGQHFTKVLPEEYWALTLQNFKRALAGEEIPAYEIEAYTCDRRRIPIELNVSSLLGPEGQVIGRIGIFRDITERKRAVETLQESERRYRGLVEAVRDVFFTLSLDGTITSLNPAFEETSGWPRTEWISKPFRHLIHPDDLALATEILQRSLQGEKLPTYELRMLSKTGEYWIGDIKVTPQMQNGNVVGILGIVRDITERKRIEQEKAALEEQFLQSQKMEAIGRLTGGIAHDFNNLLTIIKGYSQLFRIDIKENDPLMRNVEQITKATDQASGLIRQLLAFSRSQILEMKVLDFNTVLRELEKMLRRVIGEDIELTTHLTDNLGRVKTDRGQIEQVVMNLAVNARDAMPNGGKLTIETSNAELDEAYTRSHFAMTPGRYVMLSVSDTGVGMSPEVKERIFEPFFTTKEKGKGTGLGLSTVYGIIKQSEGNIWVYSEPGKGTVFKIYLPRVEEAFEEIEEKVVTEELPHGNETILVVEDEERVRQLAADLLGNQGYKVLQACDGDDALYICEQHKDPIPLMLTDVVMPKMNGRASYERVMTLHPEMKVLYMSGYTEDAIVHHGVLEEGVNYIQKPFALEGLAGKVREVLDEDSTPAV